MDLLGSLAIQPHRSGKSQAPMRHHVSSKTKSPKLKQNKTKWRISEDKTLWPLHAYTYIEHMHTYTHACTHRERENPACRVEVLLVSRCWLQGGVLVSKSSVLRGSRHPAGAI